MSGGTTSIAVTLGPATGPTSTDMFQRPTGPGGTIRAQTSCSGLTAYGTHRGPVEAPEVSRVLTAARLSPKDCPVRVTSSPPMQRTTPSCTLDTQSSAVTTGGPEVTRRLCVP